MKKSISNIAIIDAYNKGYIVDENGGVFYKGKKRSLRINTNGYYSFSIRLNVEGKGIIRLVHVHRLQAYQKFGNKIFKIGIQVRHLDSNRLNNKINNIGIGTPKENNIDKPKEEMLQGILYAVSFTKKHNHEEVLKLRSEGFSYKQIMKKLNIKSKGSIGFIINNSTASKIYKK